MEMARINSALILLFAFLIEALSTPVPNKVVSDEVNTIGKGDVGVSFGGYSASAGLGGGSAGGVLHAGAYAPGVGASAGLGGYSGGVASGNGGASSGAVGGGGAGAGVIGGAGGSHGGQHPGGQGGFFDNIFNIPISVLKAVNTYLNQKGTDNGEHPAPPPHNRPHHHHHHEAGVAAVVPEKPDSHVAGASSQAGAGAVAGSGTYASAGVVAEASASASAGTGGGHLKTGAGQGTVQFHPQKGSSNYDNIFNIPISTLDAVNQLLNG